jgi:MFS family permease
MPNLVSRQETATAPPPKSSWITQFIEPRAVPIAIIVLLTSVCYSGVLSFINFYAKSLDLAKAASIFFLMYALAILFSRPFTGPLMDRRGENIIMYPAILILAFGLFLLSQVQTASMLLICAGLLGLGFGNIQSVCQTIAVKSTSLERMGLATSTFFIFLDAGLGFGPYILGKLLEYINYSQLYFISSLLALICVVLYYLLHDRKVRAPFKTVNL